MRVNRDSIVSLARLFLRPFSSEVTQAQGDMSTPPVILLIGPTGSGKSSFVRPLTKKPHEIEVSAQKPCTTECKVHNVEVQINGHLKTFTIIDTPGFQDLPEENLVTLMNISETLRKLPHQVSGAIYFHRITDGRLMGTTRSVLAIFKSICGESFYPHVAFVTTMWDAIDRKSLAKYQILNDELQRNHLNLSVGGPGIFKRQHDDIGSSKDVLEHFALLARSGPTPPPLLLIKELSATNRIRVRKTSAGKEIMKKASSGGPNFCVVL